ncbi:MAG: energy-coupling factor transporter transmembrane protein EcfT [Proteobacteria bacterium]|nr:energy-coupling factor transporter transmembrane protein EcfT [Pseudomonadota bacterium]
MAELTSFSYRPGHSFIHKIDTRFKLLFIVIIGFSSLKASMSGILLLSLIAVCGLVMVGISLQQVVRDLYIFIFFLIFIFAVRAFSAGGVALTNPFGMSLTYDGLIEGSLVCLRIILIVLIGLLFTSTTRTAEVKAAIDWILRPFPFIPGGRVATMTGLMMRFIPVIMEQARETSSAQKARSIENRKNPFYRMVKFSIPLLERTFYNAGRISMAMEARCYSGKRTGQKLSSNINDWISLLVIISLCIISFLV